MSDLPDNLLPESASDDLDWLAFQYLSNELSVQESQQFEELLAERQDAREALATAVQLIAGLKSIDPAIDSHLETVVPEQTASKPRSISSVRSQQWALIGCAVAVLLTTSYFLTESSFRKTTNPQIVQIEPSQDDLGQLLDLWSDSAEESVVTASLDSSAEQTDLIDQQNILAESHVLEVPDWLYTAVSLPEESMN